jgi:hypothetical protein
MAGFKSGSSSPDLKLQSLRVFLAGYVTSFFLRLDSLAAYIDAVRSRDVEIASLKQAPILRISVSAGNFRTK